MSKNRKTSKRMSVVAANAMRFGSIIITLFTMVVLNILASSNHAHLLKQTGELERELKKHNADYTREESRWEEMKGPDKIERELIRHGLRMGLPKPNQNIRMRPDGVPYPGQLALKTAAQRKGEGMGKAQYRRKGR